MVGLITHSILSVSLLSASNAEETVRASGIDLVPGDTVVLLESAGGEKDFISIKNDAASMGEESSGGFCFGITQTQLALMTQVEFKKGARDSADAIAEKLIRAARDGEQVVISGFSSSSEFISEMEKLKPENSPLVAAIKNIQNNHLIQFETGKEIVLHQIVDAQNSMASGVEGAKQLVNDLETAKTKFIRDVALPVRQADQIAAQINSRQPVWMSLQGADEIDTGSNTKKEFKVQKKGHSVIAVGYIKDKNGAVKSLLVRDPNFPGQLKQVKLNSTENKWAYDDMPKAFIGDTSGLMIGTYTPTPHQQEIFGGSEEHSGLMKKLVFAKPSEDDLRMSTNCSSGGYNRMALGYATDILSHAGMMTSY